MTGGFLKHKKICGIISLVTTTCGKTQVNVTLEVGLASRMDYKDVLVIVVFVLEVGMTSGTVIIYHCLKHP